MTQVIPGYHRITCDPDILSGQPCIRGMRLSVRRVLEVLAQVDRWEDIAADYPDLEREDLPEVFRFAAEMLDVRVTAPLNPARENAA